MMSAPHDLPHGRAPGSGPPDAPGRVAPQDRDDTWVAHGAVAGLLGAATVAVFFLVVDWTAGSMLWTPSALGSAFFRGESFPVGASPSAVLVLAYTAMHGTVFAGFGLVAAQVLRVLQERTPWPGLLLAVLLFSAMELAFAGFGMAFGGGVLGELGALPIAGANGLAAAAMTLVLLRIRPGPA